MNKKFMKIMVITIPMLTLVLIASQLFHTPVAPQDEVLDMIQKNEMVEIEIAVPKDEEQGTLLQLDWIELNMLNSYEETLRTPMENVLGINFIPEKFIKTGMLYESNEGFLLQNNTLKGALQNSKFREAVDNNEIISALADAALNTFVDLEADDEMTNFYMAINAYFNLLPTTEEGYSNPSNVLTRAQFMTLVMRAETPVESHKLKLNDTFATAVGESEYSVYAQHLADYSYLDIASKSLNNMTYNGNISRAEAIYMLMSKYYPEELKAVDTSKADLADTKDGGDIATTQGFAGKDYGKSYEIVYSINNPDAGVSTDIYKALVLAESKGLIDSETRFDEAITLEESIELLVDIYKTLPIETETESDLNEWGYSNKVIPEGSKVEQTDDGKLMVTLENGIEYYVFEDGTTGMTVAQRREAKKIDPQYMEHLDGDADGMTYDEYKERQANGTLTWEDMVNLDSADMSKEEEDRRGADGLYCGDYKQREDGSRYILLDDGTILESGDALPGGGYWIDN